MSNFGAGDKCYGVPPTFDPETGDTVIEPVGAEYGYWAGAPSVAFDRASGTFYMYYRVRQPLHMGRGGECRLAKSSDGVHFETIWTAKKDDFGANSIEKGCLFRTPEGKWRLYLSYEVGQSYDRNPPAWRVDLMEADSPEELDPAESRPILDGPMFGFTFVKDPTVLVFGGEYHVYASVGLPKQNAEDEDGTIRPTGRGWTALFRSHDGVNFREGRIVLSPTGHGWDAFNARITSVCYLPPAWVAYYDGATHRADSYDEFCGLAVSTNLVDFRRVSVERPWVESPHASRSIRYLDALLVGDTMHYYYEYTRADKAHELRHNAAKLG